MPPDQLIEGGTVKTCLSLVVFWLCGALCVAVLQQQEPSPALPVFRVTARVAVVDAQVLDKKSHRPVKNLTQDDFEVYEDGVRQKLTSFSQDELPLSMVLLFDLTDSVRPVLRPLADNALRALQHLKPEDEVSVMTYSASAQVLQDFTRDRDLAVRAIRKASKTESDEAAFFNEGIFRAATQLEKSRISGSRRVIIWFTDDIPNIPSEEIRAHYGRSLGKAPLHTAQDSLKELLRSGGAVFTLLQRSRMSDEQFSYNLSKGFETQVSRMQHPPGDVYEYAVATDGDVVEAAGKKTADRLAEMIDSIRLRYTLSYHPVTQRPPGHFCAIKVKLTPAARKAHGGIVIEAKRGYYR